MGNFGIREYRPPAVDGVDDQRVKSACRRFSRVFGHGVHWTTLSDYLQGVVGLHLVQANAVAIFAKFAKDYLRVLFDLPKSGRIEPIDYALLREIYLADDPCRMGDVLFFCASANFWGSRALPERAHARPDPDSPLPRVLAEDEEDFPVPFASFAGTMIHLFSALADDPVRLASKYASDIFAAAGFTRQELRDIPPDVLTRAWYTEHEDAMREIGNYPMLTRSAFLDAMQSVDMLPLDRLYQ